MYHKLQLWIKKKLEKEKKALKDSRVLLTKESDIFKSLESDNEDLIPGTPQTKKPPSKQLRKSAAATKTTKKRTICDNASKEKANMVPKIVLIIN